MKTILKSFLLMLLLSSCSIKEDRVGCPCWLHVWLDQAFSETDRDADRLRLLVYSNGLYYAKTLDTNPEGGYHVVTVPKGEIVLCAACGLIKDSEYQMVTYGRQADSLYAYAKPITATDEIIEDRVILAKQFSTIIIQFGDGKNGMYQDDPIEYKLVVNGTTGGLRLTDLSPVEGSFRCEPERNSDGQYVFRVIRQSSDDLSLDIYTMDGHYINTYPIGQMIAESGFDWNMLNLDDIRITIDLTEIESDIHVNDWELITITASM